MTPLGRENIRLRNVFIFELNVEGYLLSLEGVYQSLSHSFWMQAVKIFITWITYWCIKGQIFQFRMHQKAWPVDRAWNDIRFKTHPGAAYWIFILSPSYFTLPWRAVVVWISLLKVWSFHRLSVAFFRLNCGAHLHPYRMLLLLASMLAMLPLCFVWNQKRDPDMNWIVYVITLL